MLSVSSIMTRPRVLITGATGLVGRALEPALASAGYDVFRLTRSASAGDRDIHWNPETHQILAANLENFEAIVHLAGESIADGRWTATKKERIYSSRVDGTRFLVDTIQSLKNPPPTVVSASAIGFYGDRGDESLEETSGSGSLFLSRVCHDWEDATEPLSKRGIRVVTPRIGVVLSRHGGALAKMLLPFKLGLGGKIGSGQQHMSWIDLDDLVVVIMAMIKNKTLSGPVNAVSPNSVPNNEFTRELGRALSRPTLFPMPAFAARLAFGEMADELLLASTRVVPKKLASIQHVFRYPRLSDCLAHLLHP